MFAGKAVLNSFLIYINLHLYLFSFNCPIRNHPVFFFSFCSACSQVNAIFSTLNFALCFRFHTLDEFHSILINLNGIYETSIYCAIKINYGFDVENCAEQIYFIYLLISFVMKSIFSLRSHPLFQALYCISPS